jgi:uncharacterized membrane protein YeaQ/YmgE (transglycosylase-associated protein family)
LHLRDDAGPISKDAACGAGLEDGPRQGRLSTARYSTVTANAVAGGGTLVIGWLIFGLVVGIVAKFLMPGRDPGGFVVTALIGIVGALLGGYIGRAVGWYREGDPVGFVMAVLGAIILLALYRMIIGRRTVGT